MNQATFKQLFFKKNVDKRGLISSLKEQCSNPSELRKFENLFQTDLRLFNGLFKQVVYGTNNLPNEYSKLDGSILHHFSNSIAYEINWQVFGFVKHKELINKFIQFRGKYEHYLLLGEYEIARTLLETVEKEVCVSYWTIENKLLLDEIQYGSEKNWSTRNILLDDRNYPNVHVFTDLYSKKAEINYSFFQFNEYLKKWEETQRNSKYGLSYEIQAYVRFKANYFSFRRYDGYASILYHECGASLIDRYIMVMRLLHHIAMDRDEEGLKIVDNTVQYLHPSIEDPEFQNLLLVSSSNANGQADIEASIPITIIDCYTAGRYEDAVNQSKTFLSDSASFCLEILLIYTKSLIEQGRDFEPITDTDSIINNIGALYHKVLEKKNDSDEPFVNLVKLSYTFNTSAIGLKIYSFIVEQLGWKTDIDFAFLSKSTSTFLNPSLLDSVFNHEEIRGRVAENLNNAMGGSLTVKIFNSFHGEKSGNFELDYIPEVKSIVYRARHHFYKKEYPESIDLYKEVLEREDIISPIAEYEAISNIYDAYFATKQVEQCIRIFVKYYLKNSSLVKKMEIEDLLALIINEKFKNVGSIKGLIELPIFFKVNSDDKIRIKQAYDLFLRENGCAKPHELFANIVGFEKVEAVYFLRNVCVFEILELSRHFKSTYEVNEERIKICQKLAELDPLNTKIYNDEIAALTQRNTISKVIGKIDEGKIFVNEERLMKFFLRSESRTDVSKLQSASIETKLTKEYFYRTVDLSKFTQNNEYKQVSNIVFGGLDEEGKLKLSGNPAFDDFKQMFLEIRDHFVSSNEFGLDAYLSTRIRHGTLPNHIRSVFERFFLVTSQSDGIYAINSYWDDKVNLNQEEQQRLQAILADFSSNVDTISSYLKEELIQCKTEKRKEKPNALFNYSYDDDLSLLILYFSQIHNYEEFIRLCFDELWSRTNKCLDHIRDTLDVNIKSQFTDLVALVEDRLTTEFERNQVQELLYSLNQSRTEIQIVLSNIGKWFQRSESSFDGIYELSMLIETSIQITKNINPSYGFSINFQDCPELNIKGEYHQHLIDVMRNFLDNMIKRPKLPMDALNASLIVEENGGFLTFKFSNKVSENINPDILISKLDQVRENWDNPDSNVSQEEGTGFPKIKRILQSDLDRKQSRFDYEFDNFFLTLNLTFETSNLLS